jgi:hypothetical protein
MLEQRGEDPANEIRSCKPSSWHIDTNFILLFPFFALFFGEGIDEQPR